MNRRGFFAGMAALLGVGAARAVVPAQAEQPAHEHKWLKTPYVLVYGEVAIQRGPELLVCKCGALRIEYERHRGAMLQRAYDEALAASNRRTTGRDCPVTV